jgi:hypothetical protein
MTRSYTMQGVMGAADRAVQLARTYLTWREPGSLIHDVQNDPRFQHRGVDLLWDVAGQVRAVEVKGDRHASRGTYFFELVSNLEKNTPGCFLYSGADLLLYAFIEKRELHVLPLVETRRWFLPQAARYPIKHTQTRLGDQRYSTVGVAVPVLDVLRAVSTAERLKIGTDGTAHPMRRPDRSLR